MTEQKPETANDLQIVKYGAEVLRRPAARVKQSGPGKTAEVNLPALTREMAVTMERANGVGLAAPQVGISLQLAIIDIGDGPIVLLNPRVVKSEGEETMTEGCLSLPGLWGEVTRAAKVVVTATDLNGKTIRIKAEGMLARALQHEIDHLNGMLFIDRVDESTLHWLVRPRKARASDDDENDAVRQPTTLQDALKVFMAHKGT